MLRFTTPSQGRCEREDKERYDIVILSRFLPAHSTLTTTSTKLGQTALHKAAAYGTLECMQLLLENAADASLVDDQGDTPLHCAAGSLDRGLESVRMLMKLGKVDPRVRNNQGYHLINPATKPPNTAFLNNYLLCS